MSATELADLLEGKDTRLILLAACNTSRITTTSGLLQNFAYELLNDPKANLPALIAMQYEVEDDNAKRFAESFFQAVAELRPVDVACAEARKQLIDNEHVSRDTFAPVLYLQAEDGALFKRAWNRAAWSLAALLVMVLIAAGIGGYWLEGQRAVEEAGRLAAQRQEAFEAERADTEATRASNEATAKATQQARADEEERIALSRELASQALNHLNDKLDLGLLLSLAAYQIDNTYEAKNALLTALQQNPRLITSQRWGKQTGYEGIMTFSPDLQTVALGGDDNSVAFWHVNTQSLIGKLPVGEKTKSVTFSPNSQIVAILKFGTVTLWNVNTQQTLTELNILGASVTFSPDSQYLAIGSFENTIFVYDLVNNQITTQFTTTPSDSNSDAVTHLSFSTNGDFLASSSPDGVFVWDTTNWQKVAQAPITGHIAFQPNKNILAIANTNIILWDVKTGQIVGQEMIGIGEGVESLAFSPDGYVLAVGFWKDTINLFETSNQQLVQSLIGHTELPYGTPVYALQFSSDGEILYAGSCGEFNGNGCLYTEIQLWDVSSSFQFLRVEPNREVMSFVDSLIFSSNSEPVFGKDVDFDANHRLVAFSTCANIGASGCEKGRVELWNTSEKKLVRNLEGHTGFVIDIDIDPNHKILASVAQYDRGVILWNFETGQQLKQVLNDYHTNSIAFSPNGDLLAIGNGDGSIALWDTKVEETTLTLDNSSNIPNSLAFSPDGQILASGYRGKNITLWDIKTGQIVHNLTSHTEVVRQVVFDPGGKTLASTGEDGLIILWDVDTGQRIGLPLVKSGQPNLTQAIFDSKDDIRHLTFNSDGRILASYDREIKAVLLWDTDLESWKARACRIANRNLTLEEWQTYLGDRPYRPTCPDLPIPAEVLDTNTTGGGCRGLEKPLARRRVAK